MEQQPGQKALESEPRGRMDTLTPQSDSISDISITWNNEGYLRDTLGPDLREIQVLFS